MLHLGRVLAENGIQASHLAAHLGVPMSSFSMIINHQRKSRQVNFKQNVEKYLKGRRISSKGIWEEIAVSPRNTRNRRRAANVSSNQPRKDEGLFLEVVMLSQNAMKHFNLFRNPFWDDVKETKDVFLTPSNRYVLAAMRDAARHQGLLAVVGDSGAGKSILRKVLIEELNRDGDTSIIFPRGFDKSRISTSNLCEAIIDDISSERPKQSVEHKARQVEKLLKMASKGGQRHVLIIEEAHDLTIPTLKYLKRFWEQEDGFSRLLGIVLIGQNELKDKLDERRHYEMRELIRRCMVVELAPLGEDLDSYLNHKFKRVGVDSKTILAPGASEVLLNRLTRQIRGGKTESNAHPLAIHNLLIRGMNIAAELGESHITPEILREV
jgi:type II secretory pathway predicted ATPase ExeA